MIMVLTWGGSVPLGSGIGEGRIGGRVKGDVSGGAEDVVRGTFLKLAVLNNFKPMQPITPKINL